MHLKTIGISEMVVSKNEEEMLITYSLGSCLGVTLYDPIVRVGGLIHCMLPTSAADKIKAIKNPAMFVDTGIPLIFREMYSMGAVKERIILKAAGCARIMDQGNYFKIGEKNIAMLHKLLSKNNLSINGEGIEGTAPQTMSLDIGTGITIVKSEGEVREL